MTNYSTNNFNTNMFNQTYEPQFDEEGFQVNFRDWTNKTQPTFFEETTTQTWDMDFNNLTRFWVHFVMIPVVVTVGIIGNMVTTYILTRKQMQTPSNIIMVHAKGRHKEQLLLKQVLMDVHAKTNQVRYLTSLAFSDILFLAFTFSMSWKHYDCMKDVWFYWQYVPFGLWITAALNSTSVWLTVSFTIERYIAVCHPLAGRVNCIGNRAKYVSWAVCTICFLLTSFIPFEWKVAAMKTPNDKEDSFQSFSINTTVYTLQNIDHGPNSTYKLLYHWFTIIIFFIVPLFIMAIMNVLLIQAVQASRRNRESLTNSHLQNQQQDRIPIILMLTVILFLICQLPKAVLLIYLSLNNPVNSGSVEENIILALENICELLVNINAACNFLLYTALSDRFRRALLTIFSSKLPSSLDIPMHAV